MKRRNPLAVVATTLFALMILVGAGAAQAAVKVRANGNGNIIVDISDNRGIASYWIFARNFRGPILAARFGIKRWGLFQCPKSASETLQLPPKNIGQAIVVKYLPCGTSVPEDYIASSITTVAADAIPYVYRNGTQVDEDGTRFRVGHYKGGFAILEDNGDGSFSLKGNFPLPSASALKPIELRPRTIGDDDNR